MIFNNSNVSFDSVKVQLETPAAPISTLLVVQDAENLPTTTQTMCTRKTICIQENYLNHFDK